jgi:hypothetical protein
MNIKLYNHIYLEEDNFQVLSYMKKIVNKIKSLCNFKNEELS